MDLWKAEKGLRDYVNAVNKIENKNRPEHEVLFQFIETEANGNFELWVKAWRSIEGKNIEEVASPIFVEEFPNIQARREEATWMIENITKSQTMI